MQALFNLFLILVNPVQVVPKKSGITVVKNNDDDLIPTRQTT